jgi:hypothetical protein
VDRVLEIRSHTIHEITPSYTKELAEGLQRKYLAITQGYMDLKANLLG